MAVRSLQLTFVKAIVILFLVSLVVTVILAAQDHDVPVSVDGIRCDSCGSECSVMCGSRSFRACCYNYIKKRSVPWSNMNAGAPSEGQDLEGNETTQQLQSKSHPPAISTTSSEIKASKPSFLKGIPGKHYLRGHITEVNGDSLEDADFIYPVSVKDLVSSVVRNLNAFESRKFAKPATY